jgi:hypothetical protein
MASKKRFSLNLFENISQYGVYLSYTQTESSQQEALEIAKVSVGTKIYVGPKKQKEGQTYKQWAFSWTEQEPAPSATFPAPDQLTDNDIPF